VASKAHHAIVGVTFPHGPMKRSRQSTKYSKRDYESFAKSIRAAREKLQQPRKLGEFSEAKLEAHNEAINEIIWGLCQMFKEDNKEFEELKFIGACSSTV